jgi:hypothetical protein
MIAKEKMPVKRFVKTVAMMMLAAVILGCGAAAKEIQRKSASAREDIFVEIKDGEPMPNGYAILTIRASIKTHLEGYYLGESKDSLHGKEEYPYLINIDGQAAKWKVSGTKDSKPRYEKNSAKLPDPESGEGFNYILEKRIMLAAGSHRIFFGLPEETYFVEVEIYLGKGEMHILEFKPIYRTKRSPGTPSFLRGLDRYEVVFDAQSVAQKETQ